eukprot:g949.t1
MFISTFILLYLTSVLGNRNEIKGQPNILVILIDDMGYSDLQSYGSPNASTPHVDKLISKGKKFTQWISAASICTPSRAALQTGRYAIRTGCTGTNEQYRVVPTPSNPHGLDATKETSIAKALKAANYRTGMSGKWHLGINSNDEIGAFSPNAHGYDTYLGAPWTNAPMCEMYHDGRSYLHKTGPNFCFMTANETVVEMPLRIENFTRTITDHAIEFFENSVAWYPDQPWFFFMSYFHVHSPLFTMRSNRGRSRGGEFGDNVEEMDDSVGRIMDTLQRLNLENNTLIFLTSDNGPYQEEGWEKSGRTNIYDEQTNELVGRLKGGKGQVFEGGIRMPGAVVWPGHVKPGTVSDTFVSTLDIFPTVMRQAGIEISPSRPIDGKDMSPILLDQTTESQHDVFFHYCGFRIIAGRVYGRWKVFWATQKWYTNDKKNTSVCLQCCNGINPWSKLFTPATELCGCSDKDLNFYNETHPLVYDMRHDRLELHPIDESNWPTDSKVGETYEKYEVLDRMEL